jgi:hypothetical protein
MLSIRPSTVSIYLSEGFAKMFKLHSAWFSPGAVEAQKVWRKFDHFQIVESNGNKRLRLETNKSVNA